LFAFCACLTQAASAAQEPQASGAGPVPVAEAGFVSLFDGKSLEGWILKDGSGPGYLVQEGILVCPAETGGRFLTRDEYADFTLRFEFRLEPGGNNGVGIRTPLDGRASRDGMEIQILDDYADKYANLKPAQYHGSIYGVVPAKRGALKKAGEWNREEIECRQSRVRVTLNDRVIVDADLEEIEDPEILKAHPGIRRRSGHIGFLSHGCRVEFRNIRIKDHCLNVPPQGFVALFDGKTLEGWKGLVKSPPARAKMTPEELASAQAKADEEMRQHWRVEDGILVFDGKGHSLCTAKDYGDFELLVDWKIPPGGDSGIYLRGSPQVQIWDNEVGSGGLYNNQKNPSQPAKNADRPPGTWNRFRILMQGDRVSVHLNGELVVDQVVMENYWERSKPIYPTGQIELQSHGATLYFRNIFLRVIGEDQER
jgi:hypothetical protein